MVTAVSDDLGPDEPLLMESPRRRDTATFEPRPLLDVSREELLGGIETFAETYNLTDKLHLLRRSALVLQGEIPFQDVPDITKKETQALRYETERKWRQPKTLYFTILVCSIGAIEQGWAQTSANGATLFFPNAFGIGSDSKRDNFIVGLINAAPYLSTGVLGAWVSDPINNVLGRRGAVFVGGVACFVATIGSALTQSWPQLLFFRLVLGVGLGINASTVSVFAAECAPASIRGGLAVSWQMWVAFGIFVGFVANAAVYHYGENAWRLQLAAPFIPIVPLLLLVFFCPESPAWYIKRGGRYDLAFQSLCRLRNTELQAAKELYYTYVQQRAKFKVGQREPSFFKKVIQLVSIPRNRRATIAAYVVMLSQQLCGINIIAFYSSTIFSNAGFSTFHALLASCVFGFVNFIGAFPAIWAMDTLGRRSLLLLTLPPMALTMFATGLTFNIPEDNPAHLILLAFLIYLFCAEYSPGMGPVPNTYAAESFPLSHREVGMSMAVSMANIWASILSLTFPRILTALHPQGAFYLYAALNVLAVVLVFFAVPETKKRTLEELDAVFSVGSRRFVRYQVTEYLPWVWRRWVRRERVELRALGVHEDVRGDYVGVREDEEDDEDDNDDDDGIVEEQDRGRR